MPRGTWFFVRRTQRSIPSDAFIAAYPLESQLLEKKNGETLQATEIRDGHSIALGNILEWTEQGISNTNQYDYISHSFSNPGVGSDNAYLTQNMYFSNGSYFPMDFSKVFYVMIECGSLRSTYKTDFQINACNIQQYAPGSYVLYGSGTSREISRARIMKTLFYGTTGSDPRITSTFIYQLGSVKVSDNVSEDVGKRVYYMRADGGDAIDSGTGTAAFMGSLESNSGSVWSWSRLGVQTSHLSEVWGRTRWYVDGGLKADSGIITSTSWAFGSELESDTSADVVVNPSTLELDFLSSANAVGRSVSNDGQAVILTAGSIVTNSYQESYDNPPVGSLIDFQGSGVPKFGLVGSNIRDHTLCWLITGSHPGINGSVDTAIYKFRKPTSITGSVNEYASLDFGSSFTLLQSGVLGSIVTGNNGVLRMKYEIIRAHGSDVSAPTYGYMVYYG